MADPLTAEQWQDLHTMAHELYRLRGLEVGFPLTVTPTARTAGELAQTMAESGGRVTVTKAVGVTPATFELGGGALADFVLGGDGSELVAYGTSLTDAQWQELYTWLYELHLTDGLRSGSPLVNTQRQRTAGAITQAVNDTGQQTVITRS